jgi:CHAD domain-containing protein
MSDKRAHRIRKELKKARASLRVLRGGLGNRLYRRENAVLRDASRVISPLRDARAQVDLLAALGKRFREDLAPGELTSIEVPLRKDLERTRRLVRSTAPSVQHMVQSLRDSLQRLRRVAAGATDGTEVRKALRRIYSGARKAFGTARSIPSSTTLHEWRKKTKYLYNALEVVGPKHGRDISPRIGKRAQKLGDWLGEEHDLVVLSSELCRPSTRTRARGKLDRLIAQRRRKLAKKALRLGARTYAAGPKKAIH